MSTVWVGPQKNPLTAAALVAARHGEVGTLEECGISLLNWHVIDPGDDILDDLLQEIAGATDIVVQYRDGGWYAAMDNGE